MAFVLDTSIWIRIWRNHPPDIFAAFWEQLRASIANGDVRAPEDVLHELKKGQDGLGEILAAENGLFLPLDADLQGAVGAVMQVCPDLADADGERNRADPFVVAAGLLNGHTVVTGERPRKAQTARRKIPDACDEMGVLYTDWFGFLRSVGWKL